MVLLDRFPRMLLLQENLAQCVMRFWNIGLELNGRGKMQSGFCNPTLFRECFPQILMGKEVAGSHCQGVLKQGDAVLPVSHLSAADRSAKKQEQDRSARHDPGPIGPSAG